MGLDYTPPKLWLPPKPAIVRAASLKEVEATFPFAMTRRIGYTPPAVTFDGTNDYLTRGADFTGMADNKVGLFSIWIKPVSAATNRSIYSGTAQFQEFRLGTAGTFIVDIYTSVPAGILRMNTTAISTSAWSHIMGSWDLAASAAHLYVNGVSDKTVTIGPTNNTIDWTRANHGVGAVPDGTGKIETDMADFYLNPAVYMDLSVQSNREKFILGGKPVFLGATGSLPTGSSPILFLSGDASTFATNKGTGGGMTVTGALTDAATSP